MIVFQLFLTSFSSFVFVEVWKILTNFKKDCFQQVLDFFFLEKVLKIFTNFRKNVSIGKIFFGVCGPIFQQIILSRTLFKISISSIWFRLFHSVASICFITSWLLCNRFDCRHALRDQRVFYPRVFYALSISSTRLNYNVCARNWHSASRR